MPSRFSATKPELYFEHTFILTLDKKDYRTDRRIISEEVTVFNRQGLSISYGVKINVMWSGSPTQIVLSEIPRRVSDGYCGSNVCDYNYGKIDDEAEHRLRIVQLSSGSWQGRKHLDRQFGPNNHRNWGTDPPEWVVRDDELSTMIAAVEASDSGVEFRVTISNCAKNKKASAAVECDNCLTSALQQSRHSFDVLFSFPALNCQLWESAEFLRMKSDYWKDLFNSGFEESVMLSKSEAQVSREEDKTDMACSLPFYRIVIKDEDVDQYETYAAILGYLRSSTIHFGELATAEAHRATVVNQRQVVATASSYTKPASVGTALPHSTVHAASPSVPLPEATPVLQTKVCPRKVYELALYLQLPSLADVALQYYKHQITKETVAYELFSRFADTYEEVHTYLLTYCVRNWDQVKSTQGLVNMQNRLATRDPELEEIDATTTLFKLLMNVSKA